MALSDVRWITVGYYLAVDGVIDACSADADGLVSYLRDTGKTGMVYGIQVPLGGTTRAGALVVANPLLGTTGDFLGKYNKFGGDG